MDKMWQAIVKFRQDGRDIYHTENFDQGLDSYQWGQAQVYAMSVRQSGFAVRLDGDRCMHYPPHCVVNVLVHRP